MQNKNNQILDLKKEPYIFKVSMVGLEKESLTQFSDKYFISPYHDIKYSIGVEFYIKKILHRKVRYKLQMWLLSVDSRFNFLIPTYIKYSSAIIIFLSSCKSMLLDKVKKFLEKAVHEFPKSYQSVPIVLVFNHSSQLPISQEDHERLLQFDKDINADGYIEISLKTGENVEILFEIIMNLILRSQSKGMNILR